MMMLNIHSLASSYSSDLIGEGGRNENVFFSERFAQKLRNIKCALEDEGHCAIITQEDGGALLQQVNGRSFEVLDTFDLIELAEEPKTNQDAPSLAGPELSRSQGNLRDCLHDDGVLAKQILTRAEFRGRILRFADGMKNEMWVNGDEAARNGHLHLLQSNQFLVVSTRATAEASKGGHLQVIEWLDKQKAGADAFRWEATMNEAAASGKLHVIEWLTKFKEEASLSSTAIDNAAKEGHLAVLEWLHFKHGFTGQISTRTMDGAAENNHIQVLKFLRASQPGARFSEIAIIKASRNNHIQALEWLYLNSSCCAVMEQCSTQQCEIYNKDIISRAVCAAARGGAVRALAWLARGPPPPPAAAAAAAAPSPPPPPPPPPPPLWAPGGCGGAALEDAAAQGHLGAVRWLCGAAAAAAAAATAAATTTAARPGGPRTAAAAAPAAAAAAPAAAAASESVALGPAATRGAALALERGHREVAEWLFQHLWETEAAAGVRGGRERDERRRQQGRRPPAATGWSPPSSPGSRPARTEREAAAAAAAAPPADVRWWGLCADGLALQAAWAGDLGLLRWLLLPAAPAAAAAAPAAAAAAGRAERFPGAARRLQKDARLLETAAASGHLNVVEWLHYHGLARGSPAAMDSAAAAGHLSVVEFLHRARREGCTPWALRGAAQNGHLSTAVWLLENRQEGF